MNIIELAKQAGFERLGHDDDDWVCYPEEIETFAELVIAHEREECAKVCEDNADDGTEGVWDDCCHNLARKIRARSKA